MAASHASRHGNTAFSSAKAAGAALERRPSRPLSLPRSTPGARPCARGACATSETDGHARGRGCGRGGAQGCDAREGLASHPWAPQHPTGESARKSKAAAAANQGVGARAEARGGCGGLTGGDAAPSSCWNRPRAPSCATRRAEGQIRDAVPVQLSQLLGG